MSTSPSSPSPHLQRELRPRTPSTGSSEITTEAWTLTTDTPSTDFVIVQAPLPKASNGEVISSPLTAKSSITTRASESELNPNAANFNPDKQPENTIITSSHQHQHQHPDDAALPTHFHLLQSHTSINATRFPPLEFGSQYEEIQHALENIHSYSQRKQELSSKGWGSNPFHSYNGRRYNRSNRFMNRVIAGHQFRNSRSGSGRDANSDAKSWRSGQEEVVEQLVEIGTGVAEEKGER